MKFSKIDLKTTFKTFVSVSLLVSGAMTNAEDTEVFYSVNVSKPNVMFVLDISGSMGATVPGTGGQSRIQVLQSAFSGVLAAAPDNVKIGIMNYGQVSTRWWVQDERFRQHSVSGVGFPVTDINALVKPITDQYGTGGLVAPFATETVREYLPRVVNGWQQRSYTPIVDSLYEAALYYRGEKMHYGITSPTTGGAHPATYEGTAITQNVANVGRHNITVSVPGVGGSVVPKYKSPIESSCQSNYIVLMTDGAPTYLTINNNGHAQYDTGPFNRVMRGDSSYSRLAGDISHCNNAAGGMWTGKCGKEITHYLADNDNIPDPSATFPNGQEGDQLIKTYVVGFGSGLSGGAKDYLKSLETIDDDPNTTKVEDGYFEADNPQTLIDTFASILSDIAEPQGTLASPGYSVNVKSGLEHEKDIYIPVFDRKNASRWSGNLKKFKIVDVNDRRLIRGKNNINAVDELGGFTSEALDYWSTSSNSNPDGKDVEKGGLASLLTDPDKRHIYSNITNNLNLYSSGNKLVEGNSNITNDKLGIPSGSSSSYRKKLINFMRGWKDGDRDGGHGDVRKHMGDMLHSEPIVITYNVGDASGSGKKQYIFAGTNEGYLHAFDTDSGKEQFAFIPAEFLKTIVEPQFRNEGTQSDHKYGVDGTLTYWFKDDGVKGVVDGSDHVYLYFGLRRGGTSYYALDITNVNKPKLLWTKSASDYPSMGQSWSAPYLAKVTDSSGNIKEVVIISGGYDPAEDRDKVSEPGILDNASAPVTASKGNDILILDAKKGDLVWSMPAAMRSQIKSSIPGGVRILDTNYNGSVDRMYFGDTGGNLWRLDLSEDSNTPSKLTKLAQLASTGSSARKFYNEPDVAIMKLGGESIFVVSLGSGFRAHPMDSSITDKFYMIKDTSPFESLETSGPNAFSTITEGDLASITISGSGSGTSVTQTGSFSDTDKKGWVVNLPESGEKVLATAVTFDGVITFTTLVPEALTSGVGIDQCAAPATQGRLYAIDVLNGGAGLDLNLDGTVSDADIYTLVAKGEIPGKPQAIVNSLEVADELDGSGNPTGNQTCKHPVDIRIGKKLSQATGYDTCRLESVYWSDPVSDK